MPEVNQGWYLLDDQGRLVQIKAPNMQDAKLDVVQQVADRTLQKEPDLQNPQVIWVSGLRLER